MRRSTRRPIPSGLLGVTVLGIMLWAQLAAAQRVVVLEFEGDRKGKIRGQVERALKTSDVVEVVSLKEYRRAGVTKKLKGSQLMSSAGVARVAPSLKLRAAVEGTVGSSFFVRILDSTGAELWSKNLPVRRGAISAEHAFKLAKAIAAAAKAAKSPVEVAAAEEEQDEAEEPPVRGEDDERDEEGPAVEVTERDRAEERERERRRREEMEEAHTSVGPEEDPDLRQETKTKKRGPGPRMVTLALTGTTTWRAYCSRPGVINCRAYDALPEGDRPKGDTVDFSPQVPYAGFGLGIAFFPLAFLDNPANGIGILAGYSRGFSLTNVRVTSPSGEAPEKQVISVDQGIDAAATYRYHFSFGGGADGAVGFAGAKAGISVRSFEVDPTAQVPLPGSQRVYPLVGLEVSVPLARMVRLEGAASYFFNPKPGPDEIAGYGNPSDPTGGAEGQGFSFEAGVAGDVWGPLGYTLRFKLANYADRYYGQGQKWPCDDNQCGGSAQETYSGLHWGLTASF